MNKFDKLYKKIISESVRDDGRDPTQEDLNKYFEANGITSDDAYVNLREGDYVEEFGGNSGIGWNSNSGNAYCITSVLFPGCYTLNSVPIKNTGTNEDQHWTINADRLGESDLVKTVVYASKDRETGEVCLHKFNRFIDGEMAFYDSGFKIIDDIDSFLANKKIDMNFSPYRR